MLGGSLWVSLLRNSMGAALIMGIFLLLDRPRFLMKRTIAYYLAFGAAAAGAYSVWYLVDRDMFVRFSGMVTIPLVGIFCILMSADFLYLSIYKLTLGFYLLSVTVFVGIDASRLWLGGNPWADIVLRIIVITIIFFLIIKYVRSHFQEGREFLGEVMDLPSAVTLIVIVMIAFMGAYWPDSHPLSVSRVMRIAAMLAMAGIIQWMTFRAYFYRGREHYCRIEKDLLEVNELLLRRQLKQMKTLDTEKDRGRHICTNATVRSILAVYEEYAEVEGIRTKMYADIDEKIAVREIDMAAILVSILEKAIHDCCHAGKEEPWIYLSLVQNKNKIVIQCENCCISEERRGEYQEHWRVKASSICNVIGYYNGEMEFYVEDGRFIFRILLNTGNGSLKTQ